MPRVRRTVTSLVLALLVCWTSIVAADREVRVMTSGAFTAAFLELVPVFERESGVKVVTSFGASLGDAPDSIPRRLARGEAADVLIMADTALDALIARGAVTAGSRVDLVRSSIGMVVRSGAPKPDISSVDALRQTLLRARSIAYSASASGTYLSTELFPRLGIADAVKGKSRRIESERVAVVVARGDAEIGFQQVSELLPVKGVDYVGPLPAGAQRVTVFSAGLAAGSRNPDAGKALVAFLASPARASTIARSGLEPIAAPPSARP